MDLFTEYANFNALPVSMLEMQIIFAFLIVVQVYGEIMKQENV